MVTGDSGCIPGRAEPQVVSSLSHTKAVMLASLLRGDIPSDPGPWVTAQGGISGSRGQVPQLQVANTPLFI